ncbi:hypothetical protein HDU93_001953 [Gonapodya sp. JEL0774]|nr:hypothetical protein HDU93_001953 [Gonapodya sp. JEL0774]
MEREVGTEVEEEDEGVTESSSSFSYPPPGATSRVPSTSSLAPSSSSFSPSAANSLSSSFRGPHSTTSSTGFTFAQTHLYPHGLGIAHGTGSNLNPKQLGPGGTAAAAGRAARGGRSVSVAVAEQAGFKFHGRPESGVFGSVGGAAGSPAGTRPRAVSGVASHSSAGRAAAAAAVGAAVGGAAGVGGQAAADVRFPTLVTDFKRREITPVMGMEFAERFGLTSPGVSTGLPAPPSIPSALSLDRSGHLRRDHQSRIARRPSLSTSFAAASAVVVGAVADAHSGLPRPSIESRARTLLAAFGAGGGSGDWDARSGSARSSRDSMASMSGGSDVGGSGAVVGTKRMSMAGMMSNVTVGRAPSLSLFRNRGSSGGSSIVDTGTGTGAGASVTGAGAHGSAQGSGSATLSSPAAKSSGLAPAQDDNVVYVRRWGESDDWAGYAADQGKAGEFDMTGWEVWKAGVGARDEEGAGWVDRMRAGLRNLTTQTRMAGENLQDKVFNRRRPPPDLYTVLFGRQRSERYLREDDEFTRVLSARFAIQSVSLFTKLSSSHSKLDLRSSMASSLGALEGDGYEEYTLGEMRRFGLFAPRAEQTSEVPQPQNFMAGRPITLQMHASVLTNVDTPYVSAIGSPTSSAPNSAFQTPSGSPVKPTNDRPPTAITSGMSSSTGSVASSVTITPRDSRPGLASLAVALGRSPSQHGGTSQAPQASPTRLAVLLRHGPQAGRDKDKEREREENERKFEELVRSSSALSKTAWEAALESVEDGDGSGEPGREDPDSMSPVAERFGLGGLSGRGADSESLAATQTSRTSESRASMGASALLPVDGEDDKTSARTGSSGGVGAVVADSGFGEMFSGTKSHSLREPVKLGAAGVLAKVLDSGYGTMGKTQTPPS